MSPVMATRCHLQGWGIPVQWDPISGDGVGPGTLCSEVPCQWGGGRIGMGWGGGSLYDEVQCIMGNSHMRPHCGQNDGQTQLKNYLLAIPLVGGKCKRNKFEMHRQILLKF